MIGRGADSNLESSLGLNLFFTTRILYSSVIFCVLLASGYRRIYIVCTTLRTVVMSHENGTDLYRGSSELRRKA